MFDVTEREELKKKAAKFVKIHKKKAGDEPVAAPTSSKKAPPAGSGGKAKTK
jgi:hypothetical protein